MNTRWRNSGKEGYREEPAHTSNSSRDWGNKKVEGSGSGGRPGSWRGFGKGLRRGCWDRRCRR